ncbi:hypothetical protein MFFC18_18880 [Mariniblastus fucicola]|uniref:Uncharacterized protein n=1 Tax=Mariniblastus fucicola TaxID=980251 RepID=A0A5B9P623_9BACT|nr:hypothetical protein MFFC18_18880 [Mariniblastus fucicola]
MASSCGSRGPRITRMGRELKCIDRLEALPTRSFDVHESHESARMRCVETTDEVHVLCASAPLREALVALDLWWFRMAGVGGPRMTRIGRELNAMTGWKPGPPDATQFAFIFVAIRVIRGQLSNPPTPSSVATEQSQQKKAAGHRI